MQETEKVGRNEERVVEPLSFREVVKETDSSALQYKPASRG
ncbi:hypothetical protein [Methanosarcina barkeri]|nr:hypothetical protein [Methanosarcina barkeri]